MKNKQQNIRSDMSNGGILDKIEAHSDDSSVVDVDGDALRLDQELPEKQLFYTEEEELEDEQQYEDTIAAKRVRFKRRQRDLDADAEPRAQDAWDFAQVVRNEFRDKLPSNYEIKRWKKPSKHMVRSVVQLIETSFEAAIEQVFEKYRVELQSVVPDPAPLYRQKHIIMSDILSKLKHQLKRTKFPSRISDRDVDIEYIVSKRKYIQARYAQELANAEKLEDELIRQQERLKEARKMFENLQESNKRRLTDRLLRNDLHPSLVKAMENAYGLIPDADMRNNPKAYERDVQDLELESAGPLHYTIEPEIEELLPALQEYRNISQRLYDNIDKFMARNHHDLIKSTLENCRPKSSRDHS